MRGGSSCVVRRACTDLDNGSAVVYLIFWFSSISLRWVQSGANVAVCALTYHSPA